MSFRSIQAETGAKATGDGAEEVQLWDGTCLGQPERSACILGFVAGQGGGTTASEQELAKDIPWGFSLGLRKVHAATKHLEKL